MGGEIFLTTDLSQPKQSKASNVWMKTGNDIFFLGAHVALKKLFDKLNICVENLVPGRKGYNLLVIIYNNNSTTNKNKNYYY